MRVNLILPWHHWVGAPGVSALERVTSKYGLKC
jgi:hypothetical protein